MNFFKSVFAVDQDPSSSSASSLPSETFSDQRRNDEDVPTPDTGVWGFGGMIQTLTSRSESVIQTYRRDLEEFGSGLKKETASIRDVAARVVSDLPGSLEVGASVAQESLESVGQVIDEFGGTVWRGTAEIVLQGKDALLSVEGEDDASAVVLSGRGYSRFEMQVMAIQADQKTFLDDPDDAEDFKVWKESFSFAEKDDEIDTLCSENNIVANMFEKLVPGAVSYDVFWTRYIYKIYKLKQAEDARAELVKRVISGEEEEDLSWEVDDEDEKEKEEQKQNEPQQQKQRDEQEEEVVVVMVEQQNEGNKQEDIEVEKNMLSTTKSVGLKNDDNKSSDSDEIGWDEIEDLGENDDKKPSLTTAISVNTSKAEEIRKKLSVTEDDDEDLTWDVEDN